MACDSKEKPTGAEKNKNISETQNIEQKNKKAREIESATQIDNNISACKLTPLQWMLIKDFALQHEIDKYRKGHGFLFEKYGTNEKSAVTAIIAEIESVDGKGGRMSYLPFHMIQMAFFYELGLKPNTKCGKDMQVCIREVNGFTSEDEMMNRAEKARQKMAECEFRYD